MAPPARRLVLDGSVRRLDGGRVLLGGSPLRLFRLTPAGASLIDRIEAGQPVADNPLVARLLDAGATHPSPPDPLSRRIFEDSARSAVEGRTGRWEGVSVVVPTFGASVDDRLVAACAGVGALVVVDDGSPIAVRAPAGATLLRHDRNLGPGAARNTALAHVTTPFVAFVDADVDLPDGWLDPLLAHFDDPAVVAVAPRVAGAPGPGRLARFETLHGPLDLGPAAGPVRARTRISYVPSAVLVVRTDALRAAGGFDAALRTGEDVDLVWRLAERGGRVRYEPAVVVGHRARATLGAWLRQRVGYGRSAAPLARRHPGALAPVAVSAWSAAAWAIGTLASPVAGLAVAAGSTAALPRKLHQLEHPTREAVRLAGLGHLHAGRQLAEGITRAWWPLALVAALVSRRARRAVLLAAFVPPVRDWVRRRPPLDPASYVALRLLDHLAYGAGLWQGMLRERTLDPIVPDLSSWPGRSRYETATSRPAPAGADAPNGTAPGA